MISNMTTINKYDDKCEYNDDNDNHLCTPDYRFANQNKTWVTSSSDHWPNVMLPWKDQQ